MEIFKNNIETFKFVASMFAVVLLVFAFLSYDSNNKKLEMQEQQYNEERQAEQDRQISLGVCLTQANIDYLDFAKLNGKINDDGTINATNSTWKEAQTRKDADVKICQLKYGK